MLAIAKFGGSSLSCAANWKRVREIVTGDIARRVIVVSAAGKRHADDHKITDLLYLCHAHLRYGVPCWELWRKIASRYLAIRDECGLNVDIEAELDVLRRQMRDRLSDRRRLRRDLRKLVRPDERGFFGLAGRIPGREADGGLSRLFVCGC